MDAKENIYKGLEKLNHEPMTSENADDYHDLIESLYYLTVVEAMKNNTGYSGVYYDDRMALDGRIDMPSSSYAGRMTPRYHYSGHTGKDHMIEELRAMYEDAGSERERRTLQSAIENLEMMR